jgi:hypothetical protein
MPLYQQLGWITQPPFAQQSDPGAQRWTRIEYTRVDPVQSHRLTAGQKSAYDPSDRTLAQLLILGIQRWTRIESRAARDPSGRPPTTA